MLVLSCLTEVNSFTKPNRVSTLRGGAKEVRNKGGATDYERPVPPPPSYRSREPSIDALPPKRRREVDVGGAGGLWVAHALVLICLTTFALGHSRSPFATLVSGMQLDHSLPKGWQLVTSLICHGDVSHLMGNMFPLLVFGKLVEEELGKIALIASVLICGVVSNAISLFLLPKDSVSLGCSAAVFGLYAVSVLAKLAPRKPVGMAARARSLVDVAVFGYFVTTSFIHELQMVSEMDHLTTTNHIAHVAGVCVGAFLVWLSRRGSSGIEKSAEPSWDSRDRPAYARDPRARPPPGDRYWDQPPRSQKGQADW